MKAKVGREIRAALQSDARRLTEISFASKAYWGYQPEFFTVWAEELTISPRYISDNEVFVFVQDKRTVAYYSLVEWQKNFCFQDVRLSAGFWLEHMFVDPDYLGMGIGRALFSQLTGRCRLKGITQFGILSDPHAKGFYQKMGAQYLLEIPSNIPNRTTPYLIYRLKEKSLCC